MSGPIDPREFANDMAEQVKPLKEELERATETLTPLFRDAADAWDTACASEIAGHPDLTELNVQLDGFYPMPPEQPGKETTP